MFDSVSLWLDQQPEKGILAVLSDVEEKRNPSTGERRYVGRLKNLRVLATYNGVAASGSLPKFHLGDNLQILTRSESERAIENLSDVLGLPMGRARVNRLDIASNFSMRESVTRYFSVLGEARHYERVSYDGGLQYRNSKRALSFYDKASDQRRHRQPIPEGLGQNLLRYELKLNRRIASQIGRADVTAAMLYDEAVYCQLLDRWRAEYFAINRIHRLKLGEPVMSVKQLDRRLAVVGLKLLGEDAVFSLLESSELSPMQKYRLRTRVRELAKAKDCTEPDDCLTELDSKVKQAIAFYR